MIISTIYDFPLTKWALISYLKVYGYFAKCFHYFTNKGPSSQGYGFSSGHVWM